jgi:hypothetical protein
MKTASSLRVVKNPTTGSSLGSENISIFFVVGKA